MAFQLAGPVEFSTADLVVILLAAAAMLFALPLVAGVTTFVYYRRRAAMDPDGLAPIRRAGIAFAAVFAGQLAVVGIIDWFVG